ncbi:MAG: hypothetical protein WBG80_04315, partial [Bacteroidota bacterium]
TPVLQNRFHSIEDVSLSHTGSVLIAVIHLPVILEELFTPPGRRCENEELRGVRCSKRRCG